MGLKFQHYDDLALSNAPLKEVICQVSFTPLLEVIQKLPAEFQGQIRAHFPNFGVRQTLGIGSGQPMPSEFTFKSADDLSDVSLTLNFVALSTREYSHWNAFKDDIQRILEAFTKAYGKILIARIGLRYINQLTLKNTGVSGFEELLGILNDDLTCLLSNKSWTLPKKGFYQLSLDDENRELTLRANFEMTPDPTIILDFDSFMALAAPTEMDVASIVDTLTKFHETCYDAFRWSIKEDKIELFMAKFQK